MNSTHETLLYRTSVCWLSKGNMFARIHDMRAEMRHFFESPGKHDLQSFTSKGFQLALAYLVDIFETLDRLDQLCLMNTNRVNDYDVIRAFIAKLEL